MISIASIVYKPEGSETNPEDHYLRVPLDHADLVAGYGIEGDRKGGNPKRNLNIMSLETLEALHAEGFSTLPGQMGEQIVLRGLDLGNLSEGDQLQFGEQAIVEVVSHRTGCQRFEHIQGKSPQQAAGRMGVMARVVASGNININDPVQLLLTAKQTTKH